MHHNYYFLKALCAELNTKLVGTRLLTAYTQNKNEVIFDFQKDEDCFGIRVLLENYYAGISWEDNFKRAKKNTLDLFESLHGLEIKEVRAQYHDRSMVVCFDSALLLHFMFYGKRSNVVLYEQEQLSFSFKKNASPPDIFIARLENAIGAEDSKKKWMESSDAPKAFLSHWHPSFFKHFPSLEHLEDRRQQWEEIKRIESQLEKTSIFYLEENAVLSFFQSDGATAFSSAIEASSTLLYHFLRQYHLQKKKQSLLSTVNRNKKKALNYIRKSESKLAELTNRNYENTGHILMANLHAIPPNATSVALLDFYTDATVTIKLKPNLSPQKNAELYYRKSKNQKIEEKTLRNNIKAKKDQVAQIEKEIETITSAEQFKSLKSSEKSIHKAQKTREEKLVAPYYAFTIEGYKVWVGKNAHANDVLTLRHAKKEDLWLHAKDVAGSHVVIKNQAGKSIPSQVIEKAAALAAYYSKRKTDSLCPVAYTLKKYVRKRKGAPAGQVVMERETVLMVRPEKYEA